MGCQKAAATIGGRAMAVIQGLKGGGQLERQAVTRGEAVGGRFGPPADRGVGEGTEHRRQPQETSTPPTIR
jgi:hypothetical protein